MMPLSMVDGATDARLPRPGFDDCSATFLTREGTSAFEIAPSRSLADFLIDSGSAALADFLVDLQIVCSEPCMRHFIYDFNNVSPPKHMCQFCVLIKIEFFIPCSNFLLLLEAFFTKPVSLGNVLQWGIAAGQMTTIVAAVTK